MSKLGKMLGLVFAMLVLVLAAGITFSIGWHPFVGPRKRALTARMFPSTPERLARGEYLVRNVADCMGCHAIVWPDRSMRPFAGRLSLKSFPLIPRARAALPPLLLSDN